MFICLYMSRFYIYQFFQNFMNNNIMDSSIYGIIPNMFLAIIILVITNILFSNHNRETFDAKINRSTKEKFGIMCTKVFGCKAFSTGENNTCYLSKSNILNKPTKSKFAEDYNNEIEKCNKISVLKDIQEHTSLEKKLNALYMCNTKNDVNFKIYDNVEKIINSPNDIQYINVDEYSSVDIDWDKEITLDDYPEFIKNPDKIKYVTVMNEENKEFMGQYMYPHKCSGNISQRDCINHCAKNEKCVGTEWNPTYIKKLKNKDEYIYILHKGVCCPKIKITNKIPRRKNYENGKFYLKKIIDKNNVTKSMIIT